VQELVVAEQKQSRVSFDLSISVVNAAAMRLTAAILKESGNIHVVSCRWPDRQVCNFELDTIVPKAAFM
jgi:hypothetical protein